MDNQRKFPLFLDGFWLKIIALLTMTIDHIGYLMPYNETAIVFRWIGRLAFPLFCFMIAEGVFYTKSFKKYALRLGIMASVISVALIGMEYIPDLGSMRDEGIIFVDLLLGALAVYCLKQEKWYFKLLAILPLAYGIGSFIAGSLERCGCHGHILWFPFFMRTQYGFYGVLMIILFYVARLLGEQFIKYHSGITGIDRSLYQGSNLERQVLNIFSVLMIAIATFIYYLVIQMMPSKYTQWFDNMQLFAIASGVFILLYNGHRGYNGKWFQYGSYLYYPLHMVILYFIFALINGGF